MSLRHSLRELIMLRQLFKIIRISAPRCNRYLQVKLLFVFNNSLYMSARHKAILKNLLKKILKWVKFFIHPSDFLLSYHTCSFNLIATAEGKTKLKKYPMRNMKIMLFDSLHFCQTFHLL